MKTRMKSKSLLARTSSVVALTLLAALISIGGSRAGQADDNESFSPPVQDAILLPVKDLNALEQRLAYLEGAVKALTAASQHIDTRQLCVSDDSGAQTCVTKAQLDALLVGQPHGMQAASPPATGEGAHAAPTAEAASIEATPDKSQSAPATLSNEDSQKDQDPEQTGTITVTSASAEVKPAADSGLSPVQSLAAEGTDAESKTVRAELSQEGQLAPAGAEVSPSARELNAVPEHESPAGGDLP
jgi:hypothetical protein